MSWRCSLIPMESKTDIGINKRIVKRSMVSWFSSFFDFMNVNLLLQNNLGMSDDLLAKIFTFYAAVVIHPKVWEYLQKHHSKMGETSPIT